MPSSFFSKFVKSPANSPAGNRKPSPSPSRHSLRRESAVSTGSQHEFPSADDAPFSDTPRLVLTNHDDSGIPVEPELQSPASWNRSDPPKHANSTETRHRRAITLAVDDRDLPTPTDSTFRPTEPTSPRARVNSVPDTPRERIASSYIDNDQPPAVNSDARQPRVAIPSSSTTRPADMHEDEREADGNNIVNSPDSIKATHMNDPVSPKLLPQQAEQDVDGASATSSVGKKARQPWRSSSTSRKQTGGGKKPTGIAGALAASGLAMANHAQSINIPASIQQQLPLAPSSTTNPSSSQLSTSPSGRTRRDISLLSVNTSRSQQSDNDGDDSDGGYESPDLDLNDDDIPVTGFAVASAKRNADFHELFPTIPEGDYLIDDYGCALQREILIQGRMYISENHVCFHANIFGWITDLTIPMYDILSLEKKMTALFIPNAIMLNTRKAKYTFASFLARDTVYDVLHNIWRTARPDASSMDAASARASLDDVNGGPSRVSIDGLPLTGITVPPAANSEGKKATQCACGKKGEHYPEKVLECILAGTPDKVYTLLFQSAFMNQFRREEQKLTEIQISEWSPAGADTKLLSRNMSYIKPLSGPIGPKQTKCEVVDETVYLDFEQYVSTVTTTRTPDVPSGGVFSVKTRTCLMWAGKNSTRVIVTTTVEWTGRSFIKSVIEKSALDGQRVYHLDLERHIKRYITEHITEFVPEGEAAPAEEEAAAALADTSGDADKTGSSTADHRHEPDRRGLQWALDTFTGAYKVGKQSATGAIELLRDAWDGSSTNSLLYGLVLILIISNIYTFLQVGKREEVGRQKAEKRKSVERQQLIGDTVRALMQEFRDSPGQSHTNPIDRTDPEGKLLSSDEARKVELHSITQTLETLEQRVAHLKSAIRELEQVAI